MITSSAAWADTFTHLLALAPRLEREGQYNLAKLARAADSLSRQAAYQVAAPTATEALAADIKQTAESLARLGVGAEVVPAMTQGADVMAGGVPLFSLLSHPHVCRTADAATVGRLVAHGPARGVRRGDSAPAGQLLRRLRADTSVPNRSATPSVVTA